MTNEQSLEMKKEKTISWEESRYSAEDSSPSSISVQGSPVSANRYKLSMKVKNLILGAKIVK